MPEYTVALGARTRGAKPLAAVGIWGVQFAECSSQESRGKKMSLDKVEVAPLLAFVQRVRRIFFSCHFKNVTPFFVSACQPSLLWGSI